MACSFECSHQAGRQASRCASLAALRSLRPPISGQQFERAADQSLDKAVVSRSAGIVAVRGSNTHVGADFVKSVAGFSLAKAEIS